MAVLHVYIRSVRDLNYTIQRELGNPTTDFFVYVVPTCTLIAISHAIALLVIITRATRRQCRRPEEPQVAVAPIATSQQQLSTLMTFVKRGLRWCSRAKIAALSKLTHWSASLEKRIGADAYQLEIIIEVLLQSFQAYKMSSLVAVVWINRLLAVVIVANCWFIPLVQVVLRKKPSAQIKILILVFDSLLDAVYTMVIPVAILYPYYMEYDVKLQSALAINAYKDTWGIKFTASMRSSS